MTCIAPEEFMELLEAGRLDHPEPNTARHLADCEACRDAWASIAASDEVLPTLRPFRRRIAFRTGSAMAASLLLLLLGSLLWIKPGAHDVRPGSSLLLQDAQKELQGLVEQLKSDDAPIRERAEKSLFALLARLGKDGLRWLRDQEKQASHPEVKSRLSAVRRRLLEPEVLWVSSIPGTSFSARAPAVNERVCLFSCSTSLWTLDAETGKLLWNTPGDGHSSAAVAAGTLYAPLARGPEVGIRAFQPTIPEPIWHHSIKDLWNPPPEHPEDYYHDAGIVLSGHWLYTGSRAGSLICLDAATGARRWATPSRGAKAALFQPTIWDGSAFVAEWNRSLLSFDAETGKLRWEAKVPGIGALAPVAVGDAVFVVTIDMRAENAGQERGACIAFSAASGKPLWKTELSAYGNGGMALIDCGGVLVVQGHTHLLGLSLKDGAILWSFPCRRFGYSTLARDDRGRVYAGSDDGFLLVVDSSRGKELLRFNLNTLPQAANAPKVSYGDDGKRPPDLGTAGCPTVVGRKVFLKSDSGLAVALRMPEFLGESE
jgi:outer membrane protein assembly factor BamB